MRIDSIAETGFSIAAGSCICNSLPASFLSPPSLCLVDCSCIGCSAAVLLRQSIATLYAAIFSALHGLQSRRSDIR